MDDASRVIVAGAGLTGLTTACMLQRAGMDVLLLEQDHRPGGAIRTYREQGFVFEAGPNTGVLSCPEAVELIESLSPLCQLETALPEAGCRWVMKGGRFLALPSGLAGGLLTPLFTWKDKLRLLGEPFRKPGTDPDECVRDLVLRRMGASFYDYAVDPFISGIYAGDAATLVTRHALPRLYRLEQQYGSFIRGAIKKASEPRDERSLKATRQVFSVRGGLERLVDALAIRIGSDRLITGVASLQVRPGPEGFEVHGVRDGAECHWKSRFVVLTAGAHALPSMIPFVGSELMSGLSNVRYAPVAQVALGYDHWEGIPLRAFGGLVPSEEHRKVLGILFPSSFLRDRAPSGGALLSLFLGGMRHPELVNLSDQELVALCIEEVSNSLRSHSKPVLTRVFRHFHAIPQYEASSDLRFRAVREVQQTFPGLIIAGNLRDGIGMADRIRQGTEIAQEIKNLSASV
jgi:oxygen-dependent protoporphyrinogen oxidase